MNREDYSCSPANVYQELDLDNTHGNSNSLYLDLVKRAVINLLYEDISFWKYDQSKQAHVMLGWFDLNARILGEDFPTEAHSMIGWRRLTNIQECAEHIFENSVKGDFVETGVFRGGSTIFMRAILKAFESTERKVYACDVFIYEKPQDGTTSQFLTFLSSLFLRVATQIPFRWWKMFLYRSVEARQRTFPRSEHPSDEWMNMFLFMASHLGEKLRTIDRRDRTSLEAVKSHFARYGLLDSQVVFLKGYFSETLPKADIQSIALLRCDGDSFESTYGVLRELYFKVSPGGFVIIDDYNTFSDCKNAVDRFRKENSIDAPMIPIDHLSMYWQKA